MGLLTSLKPHEVSRDLRGYSVLFYGTPKSGKTTIASRFPGAVIFGFEKGWSAIPGIMAQPVNSWTEFRRLLVELKDEETKKQFQTVVIDTADIAYDYCVDYICNDNNVDTIGDLPYGKGYALVAKEFDSCLRKIIQLNYGLVLISHSTERTEKDERGQEYSKIEPTLDKRGRLICERTCELVSSCVKPHVLLQVVDLSISPIVLCSHMTTWLRLLLMLLTKKQKNMIINLSPMLVRMIMMNIRWKCPSSLK